MKALSISPEYALLIWTGEKTIECRTWKTDFRGDLLICSTAKKIKDTIPGHALCVAELVDIVPFTRKHLQAAIMSPADYMPRLYAWKLRNIRTIKPIPVKGKLSIWNYNGEIEYIPDPTTEEEEEKLFREIWQPLFI